MPGLTGTVEQVLDRRLAKDCPQPLALGLSGGGDSVALALMAAAWAQANGRRLIFLTVDHGLNPASPGWTLACRRLAMELGADFQALTWTGAKPTSGLPAAARRARHGLLAQAARKAGASVILMGHTASDLAESAAMRRSGSTTPDVREWAPSPVWPEGRGVFILRPMLGVAREALRDWLRTRNRTWIDDPANEDIRFARSRARKTLTDAPVPAASGDIQGLRDLALTVREDHGLVMPRQALRQAPLPAAISLTGTACVCAGGDARLPRRDQVVRLTEALSGQGRVVMTLAGCQVHADDAQIRWIRPAGEIARSGVASLHLAAGEVGVWDGRYEILASQPVTVQALAGHLGSLTARARAELSGVPAPARGALPWFGTDQPPPGTEVFPLVLDRFQGAMGLIEREPLMPSGHAGPRQ